MINTGNYILNRLKPVNNFYAELSGWILEEKEKIFFGNNVVKLLIKRIMSHIYALE